jgi:membrane-associated protease RseP (regulator of RpoE activity)
LTVSFGQAQSPAERGLNQHWVASLLAGWFCRELAVMRRAVRISTIICLVAAVGFGLWLVRRSYQSRPAPVQVGGAVQSAWSNAVESARNRFTGGVGVLLRLDNGRPVVQGVGAGSPAEAAGLHAGDVVLEVNGAATAGMPLAQVVESFRGFTGGRVEVAVQRAGNSNVTCVIRRTSWNSLRGTTFNQIAGTNMPRGLSPITNRGGPVGPHTR